MSDCPMDTLPCIAAGYRYIDCPGPAPQIHPEEEERYQSGVKEAQPGCHSPMIG